MGKYEYYFSDQASSSKKELKKMTTLLLEHILQFIHKDKKISLSTTIVDDKTIHKINKEYRKIDRPTDVISFAYNDEDSDGETPIDDMGEIIISIDTAIKQAEFYSHPVEREIAFLFIHGFLHLSGYDHMEEKEAEEMFALQNAILNSFKYDYKEIKRWELSM